MAADPADIGPVVARFADTGQDLGAEEAIRRSVPERIDVLLACVVSRLGRATGSDEALRGRRERGADEMESG